jgi:hypothetical protein
MRRREFIGLVSAAAAWPITAYAQEKIARIGFLLIGDAEPMGPVFKALRDRGYVEGRNVNSSSVPRKETQPGFPNWQRT